jgi:peptide/nickel transport system permease protein
MTGSWAQPPWFLRAALRRLLCLALTVLLAAFLGAALVRLAPGFGMDERQLDARLSDTSRRAIAAESSAGGSLVRYFAAYFAALCRGDLGQSISFAQPVRELIGERLGLTLRSVTAGIAWSWAAAAAMTLALGLPRKRARDGAAALFGGVLLCLPAGVIAVISFYVGAGPPLAIGIILLPRILRYLRGVTGGMAARPHVLAARSRGAGGWRLELRHVWLPAAPELLALGGISVNMALGAAIPVEALCDSPGIGQLVWKAALARDLPVLVNVTILIAAITAAANLLSDAARGLVREA